MTRNETCGLCGKTFEIDQEVYEVIFRMMQEDDEDVTEGDVEILCSPCSMELVGGEVGLQGIEELGKREKGARMN